jgi:CxxC motif-containing protein
MIRKLTCIECPQGCLLSIKIENGQVMEVEGGKCPKGETYAKQEIENPVRILTSTIMTDGLEMKTAPVRTDKPIPKDKLSQAMEEVKKIHLTRTVRCKEVIVNNFMGLNVNLIATRDAY